MEAGADIINDVTALLGDPAMPEAAARSGAGVVLMHMQGEPRTMQSDPQYDDVVGEIKRFLADRLFACELAGIARKQLLIDPGFGFGKTLEHNVTVLRELQQFASLSAPLLVTALCIGFVISLFQSMTQIQEFTLAFVPKVVGVGVALLVCGNWMLHTMVTYTETLWSQIPDLLG